MSQKSESYKRSQALGSPQTESGDEWGKKEEQQGLEGSPDTTEDSPSRLNVGENKAPMETPSKTPFEEVPFRNVDYQSLTLDDLIQRSARRVKIGPNGEEIHDTTWLEVKLKINSRAASARKSNLNAPDNQTSDVVTDLNDHFEAAIEESREEEALISQGARREGSLRRQGEDGQGTLLPGSPGQLKRDSQGQRREGSHRKLVRGSLGRLKEESQAGIKGDSQAGINEDSQAGIKEDSQTGIKEDSQTGLIEASQGELREASQGRKHEGSFLGLGTPPRKSEASPKAEKYVQTNASQRVNMTPLSSQVHFVPRRSARLAEKRAQRTSPAKDSISDLKRKRLSSKPQSTKKSKQG